MLNYVTYYLSDDRTYNNLLKVFRKYQVHHPMKCLMQECIIWQWHFSGVIELKVTAKSICRDVLITRESLEYDIGKTDAAIERFFEAFLSIARLELSSLRSDYVFLRLRNEFVINSGYLKFKAAKKTGKWFLCWFGVFFQLIIQGVPVFFLRRLL